MRETIQLLRGIQDLDRDLFRARAEQRRLPEERDRRRARVDVLKHEALEVERAARELRARIKEIEDITTGQRQRIRKLESEAAGARADAALIVAFQHEIRTLRRDVSESEEEGLGLVEQNETLKKRQAELAAAIGAEEADFQAYNANVEQELAQARQREVALVAKRAERLSGASIAPDVLQQYEKLLEAREGEALALLESKTCMGCHTSVPNNVYVRLARSAELVSCPSCSRLLYLA
jgi:hypothetical protein